VFGVLNSADHLAVLFMVPDLAASHLSIFLECMYALVMYVYMKHMWSTCVSKRKQNITCDVSYMLHMWCFMYSALCMNFLCTNHLRYIPTNFSVIFSSPIVYYSCFRSKIVEHYWFGSCIWLLRTKFSDSFLQMYFKARQHGYRYVYRYPSDTDMWIDHFLKQSDTWIRLNIFFKKII
jgi:hypothetical protein